MCTPLPPQTLLWCRPYPWGSELLAALKATSPPAIDISLQLLGTLPGNRGYSCQINLTRVAPAAAAMQSSGAGPGSVWAGGTQSATAPSGSSVGSFSPCKLMVGCSSTDDLLLCRGVVLERLEQSMQVRCAWHGGVDLQAAASTLHPATPKPQRLQLHAAHQARQPPARPCWLLTSAHACGFCTGARLAGAVPGVGP